MKYFGMWDLRGKRFHKDIHNRQWMGFNLSALFSMPNTFSFLQAFVARTLLVDYLLSQTILSVFLRGTFASDKAYRKTPHIKNSLKLEFCVGEGRNAV